MSGLADHERIWFRTPDIETERQFIDEYILDAVERMEEMAACEMFIFVRAGHDPSLDEGAVIVELYGEPETIIDQERERWAESIEDGPLSEWERQDVDIPELLPEQYGEQGTVLHEELRHLATRMAPLALSAFESPPDAIDEYPEEPEGDVGWYRLLHILCNHQGYDLETEQETNLKSMEGYLDTKAQTDGVDATQAKIDEFIERLEGIRADVEQYRDEE